MRFTVHLLLVVCAALYTQGASARLEVCNKTDLVLMVAVGYDTAENRTASEGWWRIYPGFCEVPVDVAMVEGSYYLHAESNPRSTMPGDAFTWGEETALCVDLKDFRMPNALVCPQGKIRINFNQIAKSWRNLNKVDIIYTERTYDNVFHAKIAGVQRLLSILGQDIGEVDGVIGEKTLTALNSIGINNSIYGFDFRSIFPLLEQTIAQQQKLDN